MVYFFHWNTAPETTATIKISRSNFFKPLPARSYLPETTTPIPIRLPVGIKARATITPTVKRVLLDNTTKPPATAAKIEVTTCLITYAVDLFFVEVWSMIRRKIRLKIKELL